MSAPSGSGTVLKTYRGKIQYVRVASGSWPPLPQINVLWRDGDDSSWYRPEDITLTVSARVRVALCFHPLLLFVHCLSDLNCMRHCPTVVLLFVTLACTHAIVSLCRSLQREVTLLRRWCYNAAMTPPCTWFVGRSMIAPLSLACIRNSHGSRSTTSGCDVVAAPLPAAAVLVTCYPECHV